MARLIITPVQGMTSVRDTICGGLTIENATIEGGEYGPIAISSDLADDAKVASRWFSTNTIELDADWNATFSLWEAVKFYVNGQPIRIYA